MNKKPNQYDITNPGYCEYLTPVKASGKQILLRLLIVLVAFLIIAFMLYITLKTVPVVSFIFAAIIVFITWFCLQFTKIEYEYVITTGTIILSKILGARTRKDILEIKTSDITSVYPLALFKDSENRKDTFFACDKTDKYAVVIKYNSGVTEKNLVISAPSKTLSCLKYYKKSAMTGFDAK